MARKTREELNKIKKKYNVSKIFSWSRFNCYKNSPYEYFLKYVKREKPTREGIYGVSGGLCHNILEDFYSGKIKYEEMIDEYEAGLLNLNLMNLKYDRSDEDKNQAIANKYESCIRHFFKNHKVIKEKMMLEKFILIKVKNFLFQGYIDAIHKDKEGNYVITDWKTSTIYTGKKIDKEKGQLVLYAEGIRQMGIPIDKIKIRWAFLKYLIVKMPLKNGKVRESKAERHAWVGKIKSNAKMWLKDSKKYTDDEIANMLDYSVEFNTIDNLPEDIQNLYKIEDCYVEAKFNKDEIEKLTNDIYETIIEITKKEREYKNTNDDKAFWETVTDSQSYYFANLCGFNASQHKPYGVYLDQLETGVKDEYKTNKDISENDDLSWMEELDLI